MTSMPDDSIPATCGRCASRVKARGLCARHYEVWWRYERERPDCTIDGCVSPARTRGYCVKHYSRLRKNGDPLVSKYIRGGDPFCSVAGCDRLVQAKGFCTSHYWRDRYRGDVGGPIEPPRRMDWKIRQGGYVTRYLPEHPNAWASGFVLQHVYVMANVIGRPLRPGETVHHRNGVRHDNRPENLELWASRHPKGQRITDLVAWAREILEQYGADVESGRIT